jgi:DNA-binding IclR family transcriptional regulator
MNVSKLSHYLGMKRQSVLRRLNELVDRKVVERSGTHYHIAPSHAGKIDHLLRADRLIVAAFRDLQRGESVG